MRTLLLAAASALFAGSAVAQSQSNREVVVVTAERTEEIARAFVGAASAPPAHRDQLARWDGKVCAGVAGIEPGQAQFLVDRISRRAFSVGLLPGGSGCRANVLIVFTPEPDAFAHAMADQQRHFMGDMAPDTMSTRGTDALSGFLESTQAVRWWHVSSVTTTDGQTAHEPPHCSSAVDELCSPPAVDVRGTRTNNAMRKDFRNALIIVDSRQVADLSVGALADYIAMASLAQLNPGADLNGYDTILNLFAPNSPRPSQMTACDVAYLQGLYHTIRNPFHARFQERQIARHMAHDLGASSPSN